MCALFTVAAQSMSKNRASCCKRANVCYLLPSFTSLQKRMKREEHDTDVGKLQFIDSHCHLQDPRLRDTAGWLIREAKQVGVQWLVVNGTSKEDWQAVKQMSLDHSEVIPSFGLHPWFVGGRSADWLTILRSLLLEVPGAAVGEAGLDKNVVNRSGCDMETQEVILQQQLHLAQELYRPIALHCVKAYGRLYEILRKMAPFPAGFILHSYSGPPDLVEQFAACGGYFSFSGLITRMKEVKARGILEKIPHHRLLLETDCPDATPQVDTSWSMQDVVSAKNREIEESAEVHCGERECGNSKSNISRNGWHESEISGCNHPANIIAVATFVAKLLSKPYSKVACIAYENADIVFRNQIIRKMVIK